MAQRKFRGRVFSGSGEGEFYVNLYAREFEKAIGYRPYPGTLNLLLLDRMSRDSLLAGLRPIVVRPPSIAGVKLHEVYCYAALIHGYEVYVVYPKATRYGNSVVEIIARDSLRRKFNLQDGSVVEVILVQA